MKNASPPGFHLVLYQPEIPHNAGAAGRLALATGSRLHLIEPLGFSLDEKQVRRTGLDYWSQVDLAVWPDFASLRAAHPDAPVFFLTTKATRSIWQARFEPGALLVFGPESRGLPPELRPPEASWRLPMQPDSTRSLNLSTAVAITLYEACRQTALLE